jgi:hypothetical protein
MQDFLINNPVLVMIKMAFRETFFEAISSCLIYLSARKQEKDATQSGLWMIKLYFGTSNQHENC